MNKKYMYSFVALLVVGLVSAGLLTYYGEISRTITVEQSLYLESEDVGLVSVYDNVVSSDVNGDNVLCNGDACTVVVDSLLNKKVVIFRADVVSKLQDNVPFNRLITVSSTDGSWLVSGEVFVSYAYPANNGDSSTNGCWHGNDHFVTAVGSEIPMVIVGAYDGHLASPVDGYEMCVEHTESTNIVSGDLVWTGTSSGWTSEDAYGLNNCNSDSNDDGIGCMRSGTTEVSYDRPSYIIVEFPLNTVGTYDVTFSMVPITV